MEKKQREPKNLIVYEAKKNIFKKMYYKWKLRNINDEVTTTELTVVKPKRDILKKIILSLLVILVILVIAAVIVIYSKLSKIEKITLNEDELAISQNVGDNYRNIALFAVDSRNMESDVGSRSDGIIILSINENTKQIKLYSVYRDTYTEVEGHDLTKITHAYAYGGPSLAIKTLNTNLDLNISEFVTVNFEAVADVVDLMDGVEIVQLVKLQK